MFTLEGPSHRLSDRVRLSVPPFTPYEAEDVSGDLSADIRSNTVCKIQTDVVLFPIRLSDGIETAVSFHLISP